MAQLTKILSYNIIYVLKTKNGCTMYQFYKEKGSSPLLNHGNTWAKQRGGSEVCSKKETK